MRLSKRTKGLLLLLIAWALMFCVAAAVLAAADMTPSSSFDDCHGSPLPDDRGYGCTHGGLPNARM